MPYAEVNDICMDFEEHTGGEPWPRPEGAVYAGLAGVHQQSTWARLPDTRILQPSPALRRKVVPEVISIAARVLRRGDVCSPSAAAWPWGDQISGRRCRSWCW